MPAHSRSKNGVASLAYVAGIHVLLRRCKDVDGRDKPGHDSGGWNRCETRRAAANDGFRFAPPILRALPLSAVLPIWTRQAALSALFLVSYGRAGKV